MANPARAASRTAWIFLLGLVIGVGGETFLFMRAQCSRAEALLFEDFRVLGFLASELSEPKAQVLEEKARALPGVAQARYLSRDAALDELGARDPEMVRSVALLGDNPLQPVLELRPSPEIAGRWTVFLDGVSRLPGLVEARYREAELGAVLQAQFYRRFLDLASSLAAFVWCLGGAAGLWGIVGRKEPERGLEGLGPRLVAAACGAALGLGLVYAALQPLKSSSRWWAWPPAASHAALVLAGALAALWSDWAES